jgi:hypothetical protein
MSLSVWGPFSNAWKCFAYYNCYKALNIIISLITLFILSLEYCPLSISAMVQGNIILAWQWSRTSIHVYRWPEISQLTFTMVRGNIILVWQWSRTSIHIYRWPGISQLNIHNGPGQHHSSMAMVRDIHSHLWMARDITPQHSQWSGATSY